MSESNYIFIIILSALSFSLARFLRNFLVDTAYTNKNISGLSLASSGTYIIIMALLLGVFGFSVLELDMLSIIIMIIAGSLNFFAQFPSFKAMRIAETVEITIFSQIAPIIALVLGFLFLKQQIVGKHLIGFFFIMTASLILVFSEKAKHSQRNKFKTARLMLSSLFLFVLSDIVMLAGMKNYNSMDFNMLSSYFFYFEIGSLGSSLFLALLNPSWYKHLKKTYLNGKKSSKNLAYLLTHNALYASGEILYKIALVIAPAVALLSVVYQVSQLILTFFLGIFITFFFPSIGREKLNKHILIRHLIAAIFVGMGIVLVA